MSSENKSSFNAAADTRIEKFVAEYVANGGNGKVAAIKAGYSENSAESQASRLLTKAKVSELVEKSLRAQIKRIDARGDRVITELFRILSADIADAFTPDGALKSIHDIPEDLRRAIAGFEVEELFESKRDGGEQIGVLKKVKFWSKTESANLLGKHLKLWMEEAGLDAFINFEAGDVEMVLRMKT